MMKKIFEVKIRLMDGSENVYKVEANDDVVARTKAVKMETSSYTDIRKEYPGTDYCETSLICELDE